MRCKPALTINNDYCNLAQATKINGGFFEHADPKKHLAC